MYWLDYYNEIFTTRFILFNELRNSYSEKVLCSEYIKLFNSACELLKLFLHHNGLFQFDKRDIIKEAFATELIKDGEKWINALALAEIYESGEKTKFSNLILSYCKDEKFSIYVDLNNMFEKLKEDYV